MIGDNLASHLSLEIIKKCEENNIAFIFLPPNSTHLCQPLDVGVFRPVKNAWRQLLLNWKIKNKGVLPKTEFPRMITKLLDKLQPNMSQNIKSGFASSGIFPTDRNRVLTKLIPSGRSQPLNNEALNDSFTEIMKKQTATINTETRKRTKRLDVPPGKSVALADLEFLRRPNSDPGPSRAVIEDEMKT